MSSMCSRPLSISVKVVNRQSAAFAANSRPGGENAAFSVIGRGCCTGARFSRHGLQLVELAVVVERRIGRVDAVHDLEPFEPLRVALLDQLEPEHAELFRIPAAHDVQAGAPVRHVIDGGQRLGGEHRMHHRHVHGREHRDVLALRRRARPRGSSVSNDHSRLFISPPKPFQRAIGSRNSIPARSASCDTSTISLQIAGQRSGTLVRVRPPSEFIEKTPSLNLFGPCIG